jgi:hypothetical protein
MTSYNWPLELVSRNEAEELVTTEHEHFTGCGGFQKPFSNKLIIFLMDHTEKMASQLWYSNPKCICEFSHDKYQKDTVLTIV